METVTYKKNERSVEPPRFPKDNHFKLTKKNIPRYLGSLFGCLGWIMFGYTAFCYPVFPSFILMLFPIIAVPSSLYGIIKYKRRRIVLRQGVVLFVMFVILFPNLPGLLINTVNSHNRTALFNPNTPEVELFKRQFLNEYPDFFEKSDEDKAEVIERFVTSRIEWKPDYINFGLLVDFASASEVIKRGSDDCQGISAVIVALIRSLGYKYVWAVETPFHWYVVWFPTVSPDIPFGIAEMKDGISIYKEGPLNLTGTDPPLSIINDYSEFYPYPFPIMLEIMLMSGTYYRISAAKIISGPLAVPILLIYGLIPTAILIYLCYSDIDVPGNTENRRKLLKIVGKGFPASFSLSEIITFTLLMVALILPEGAVLTGILIFSIIPVIIMEISAKKRHTP